MITWSLLTESARHAPRVSPSFPPEDGTVGADFMRSQFVKQINSALRTVVATEGEEMFPKSLTLRRRNRRAVEG